MYSPKNCIKNSDDKGEGRPDHCVTSQDSWLASILGERTTAEFLAHGDAALEWFKSRQQEGFFAWFVGVLLGGALIGLGGPFWFDLYKRLSVFAQIARSLGLKPGKAAEQPAQDSQGGKAKSDHTPDGVFDAFDKSIKAKQILDAAAAQERAFAVMANISEREAEDEESR